MPCQDKNPLTREGTSQFNRVLAALNVHHADVDERNTCDLILFAKQYAAYLNYYNESNIATGTWQPLMMMDVSVTLATLASFNVEKINDYKKLLYKNILLASTAPNSHVIASRQLKFLFDMLFTLLKTVDAQVSLLPADDYKNIIEDIIKGKLKVNLANLQDKFFEKFKTEGLLDYTLSELDSDAPFEIESERSFNRANLSAVWVPAIADLDITIPAQTNYGKIVYIINHNLFNSTIDAILKGVALIVARARELFEKSLADFPRHSPHYALFLTFTRLFKTAQDELNRYTQRHLDFYFKEVLQLTNKEPLPDSAHVTFELQKTIRQQLLEKDILFKGGKDVAGKERSYRLTDDVVINKTTLVKIQAQQLDAENNQPLKIFPIANSQDGQGGKLLSADKSWKTFGHPQTNGTSRSGFAIASNILFLKEGTRTITITVTFAGEARALRHINRNARHCFDAELSGNKGWLKKNVSAVYKKLSNTLTFEITLTPNDPAIIPYSTKIHKEDFDVEVPMLKIYLNQQAGDVIPYAILCKQKVANMDVQVNVSGIKDLMLSHDSGTIDASKPFKPFGDFPDAHSSFYIGSKEIFQKKVSGLSFSFTGNNSFDGETFYLDEAKWKPFPPISGKRIENINIAPASMDFSNNEGLMANTLNGFIKLTTLRDLSMSKYLEEVTAALNQTTMKLVPGSSPAEYNLKVGQQPAPTEIKINGFAVNYEAHTQIPFTGSGEQNNNLFYHVTPFGSGRVANTIPQNSANAEASEKQSLVVDIVNSGELFLGFENGEPDSVVTVLFQVADGSSNPLKDVEHVNWHYLSNNEWYAFEKRHIIDRTDNFTCSGVVTITFPRDITNQNTIFEKGLNWIKASVKKNTDAVCDIILIQAQAARVELVQKAENKIEFRKAITANSISRLVNSNAAIKTITQPFDGFNGTTRESDNHFYTRVSERLRHKQRAISIWDYEHILLEQFPQLYKVKCLNHTGFYRDNNGQEIFCENYPGHVTVISIPDLKNNANSNLLKPYTPISTIRSIEKYLEKLASPFVKLHVKKPQFEEVQLDFAVKFYDNLDESFYTQLLNNDIERFLCPWAYGGTEISFGSSVRKSVLLNFIEERPYVDFVTCFEMHHMLRGEGNASFEKRNIEEAVASTSRSLLVSYYDELSGVKHIIKTPAGCNC